MIPGTGYVTAVDPVTAGQRERRPPFCPPAYPELAHLELIYPGFRSWYYGKVVPGISSGTRREFTARAGGRLCGVAIAKRDSERKLCTLWVADGHRSRGLAQALANRAFDWLGDNKPLFTVPEDRLADFAPLLAKWEFVEVSRLPGYYRPGKVEHAFNCGLKPDLSS